MKKYSLNVNVILPLMFLLFPLSSYSAENVTTIVDTHAGKNHSDSGVYTYVVPSGERIKDFKIIEKSKWGDASYSVRSSTDTTVEIPWRVQSHEVKALGITVDTKTASLVLDLKVITEPISTVSPSINRVAPTEIATDNKAHIPTTFTEWFISVIHDTHWGLMLMLFILLLLSLLAIWSTFPDSIKERAINHLINQIRKSEKHNK